jgi:hypothetical protein
MEEPVCRERDGEPIRERLEIKKQKTGTSLIGRDVPAVFLGDLAQTNWSVGGRALMVNAVDQDAALFWQRRGFLPSRDEPLLLYRSIAAIAASLVEARQASADR